MGKAGWDVCAGPPNPPQILHTRINSPLVSCLRFTQTLLAARTCLTVSSRAVKVDALIRIKRKMCCAEEGAVAHERDRAKDKEDSEEK